MKFEGYVGSKLGKEVFRVYRKACVKARKNRSLASIKNFKAAHERIKYRRKRVKKLNSGP